MKCPRCYSNHIRKNGEQRGKQNYICAECGCQFIEYHNTIGYSEEIKRESKRDYCRQGINAMRLIESTF